MAHIDAGKTTTTERILYYTGKSHKIGEVHEGAATMDWMEQEQERGITITSAATTCVLARQAPQHHRHARPRRFHDRGRALAARARRRRVRVSTRNQGVEPQSETVWRQADKYDVPRIVFVNKMDRIGADFFRCVEMIIDRLGARPVVIQLPIGVESRIQGHRRSRADEGGVIWHDEALGAKFTTSTFRPTCVDQAKEYREKLVEKAVEQDDDAHGGLSRRQGARRGDAQALHPQGASLTGAFFPVLCGSAFKNKGVQPLLDAVVDYLPSPIDIAADQGHRSRRATSVVRKAADDEPLALSRSRSWTTRSSAR